MATMLMTTTRSVLQYSILLSILLETVCSCEPYHVEYTIGVLEMHTMPIYTLGPVYGYVL